MEPVRTCLGCRKRSRRSELLRVVARDGKIVTDASATLPGRGAWVHPTRDCVQSAIDRRAFGRALKAGNALDTGDILMTIEAATAALEEQAD